MRVLRQGKLSVTAYMAELQHLWSELDFYCPFKVSYANNAAEFKKLTDEKQIFDSLAGLNEEFDPIRVQILDRSSNLPSLNQVFSLILSEKTRRCVMIASSADTAHSVMVAQPQSQLCGRDDRDIQIFSYYNKLEHIHDTCR
ncbi:uncharacterized protein [Elaeis guineensis]|uniref:uncharacterized protein n=1 Tax=Elaeis guineensis var. tenera TaxID=51953 RepID=UPI003C6DA4C4